MSDILIRGMEMPERGHLVLVEIDENGDVFAAYDGGLTKLAQYKAITVPDHGRLIDADALIKRLKDEKGAYFGYEAAVIGDAVEYAPTIIPASKGGET